MYRMYILIFSIPAKHSLVIYSIVCIVKLLILLFKPGMCVTYNLYIMSILYGSL